MAGVKILILFLRMRRPPRFEPPRTHSRFSRTQRWHGGLPGLPLLSLLYGLAETGQGNPSHAHESRQTIPGKFAEPQEDEISWAAGEKGTYRSQRDLRCLQCRQARETRLTIWSSRRCDASWSGDSIFNQDLGGSTGTLLPDAGDV